MSSAESTVNSKTIAALGILADEKDAIVAVILKNESNTVTKKVDF